MLNFPSSLSVLLRQIPSSFPSWVNSIYPRTLLRRCPSLCIFILWYLAVYLARLSPTFFCIHQALFPAIHSAGRRVSTITSFCSSTSCLSMVTAGCLPSLTSAHSWQMLTVFLFGTLSNIFSVKLNLAQCCLPSTTSHNKLLIILIFCAPTPEFSNKVVMFSIS